MSCALENCQLLTPLPLSERERERDTPHHCEKRDQLRAYVQVCTEEKAHKFCGPWRNKMLHLSHQKKKLKWHSRRHILIFSSFVSLIGSQKRSISRDMDHRHYHFRSFSFLQSLSTNLFSFFPLAICASAFNLHNFFLLTKFSAYDDDDIIS